MKVDLNNYNTELYGFILEISDLELPYSETEIETENNFMKSYSEYQQCGLVEKNVSLSKGSKFEVMDISERAAKKMCINLNIELSGKNHKGMMH